MSVSQVPTLPYHRTPFLAPRRQNTFHPVRLSGTCYTLLLGRALKGVVLGPPISLWHLAADLSTDSTLGWFLPRVIFNLELFTQSTLFLRHPVESRDTKVNIKGGPKPLAICQIMKEKSRKESV